MAGQQRHGLLGDLRFEAHPLFGDAPHEVAVGDVGHIADTALGDHFAQQLGPALGLGFGVAGLGELAGEVRQLLGGDRGVVGADQQPVAGAEILRPRVGRRDPHLQVGDQAREGCRRNPGVVALGVRLQADVAVRDDIGGLSGEVRIARGELDAEHPRFGDRVDVQAIVIGGEKAVLGGRAQGIAFEAGQDEQAAHRPQARGRGVELGAAGEFELLEDAAGDVARGDELHLALHRLVVGQRDLRDRIAAVRPGEEAFLVLDEDLRFGRIARRHPVDPDHRGDEAHQHRGDDPSLAPAERSSEHGGVELAPKPDLPVRTLVFAHDLHRTLASRHLLRLTRKAPRASKQASRPSGLGHSER